MAFTKIKTNQKTFLENYMRGTGKTLTSADAKARFGIQQLPARMSEMKAAGLNIKTDVATTGKTRYTITARDVNGSRAKMFAEATV
tara:strand:+ start:2163 stop:2420 length:258 start_codon:yes stop_codon:yes gene_type:complete